VQLRKIVDTFPGRFPQFKPTVVHGTQS